MPAAASNASTVRPARGASDAVSLSISDAAANRFLAGMALPLGRPDSYMSVAGLQSSSGALSPGPYRLPRELSLASSLDLANTAPTYAVGFPGSILQRLMWLRTRLLPAPAPKRRAWPARPS